MKTLLGPSLFFVLCSYVLMNQALADELADRTRPVYEEAKAQADKILRQAEVSRGNFDDFIKKSGAGYLLEKGELQINPFVYKGQVVAVYTTFRKMVSEGEAIFAGFFGDSLLVSGVPVTRFTSEQSVVIAGRVIGTKNTGQGIIPHLKYINSYFCKENNCDDLFYWKERSSQDMLRVNENLRYALERINEQFKKDLKEASHKYFESVSWVIVNRVRNWMKAQDKTGEDLCNAPGYLCNSSADIELTLTEGILATPCFIRGSGIAPDAFGADVLEGLPTVLVPDIIRGKTYTTNCKITHMGDGLDSNWLTHFDQIRETENPTSSQ